VRIADASIKRPVFAVMVVGALVVLGIVSIPRLGVDLFPKVEFPMVTVTTVLEGASPETVEREVTQPLEEAINTIDGIKNLRSTSSDGVSQVFVQFELEEDVHRKAQDVRDKVASARGDIPAETEPPVVGRVDPDATPILALLLSGPQSIKTLSELADKKLKPSLERIPGVGSVALVGSRGREVRVWIDPLRLVGYALSVDDVIAALHREHVEMPGGRIEGPRVEYTVKTKGKLASVAAIGEIVVAERNGRAVRLHDLGSVEDGMAEERTIARMNGERGVGLEIRRQSGENTVAVAEGVRREVERLRSELPAGVRLVESQDTARFIQSSVDSVFEDIVAGSILAVLVVLAFLRSGRSTLIISIAIPASLLAAFSLFYFFGFTLNVMTLMALSLSIGMLVDDAIVVLENIFRRMEEEGEEPFAAASNGTREVGLAVMASTLSTCAVFVPIAFMGGLVGQFFREFGLVVCCAVMASLLVSLTTTPMLCSRYLRVRRDHGRVYQSLERAYGALERAYGRSLAWALRHRPAVLGLLLGAVATGALAARFVPFDFVTSEDRSEFNVFLKLPLGSTIQQTVALTTRVEAEIRRHPEVREVFTTIGSGLQKRVNEANLYVALTHKTKRHERQDEIMGEMRERIAGLGLPLTEFAVERIEWFNLAGARQAELMYSLRGPDIERLNFLSQTLMQRLRDEPGFVDVASSYEAGKPEIALDLSRERAATLGISAAQIGNTIAALLAGLKVGTFEEAGERYDVRVQVLPEYRDDPAKLALLRVRAPSGALVPLDNLATARISSGPVQINRENRSRAITVFANLEGRSLGEAAPLVERIAREVGITGDYHLVPVGATESMDETVHAIAFAFFLAMTALYMILASQFNSFVHPFTIMMSAPLSFVGAFAAMALFRFHLDMMGQIGFLMLMGLVMKNGILLVEYANAERERGASARDGMLAAGPIRLRPVLMTAISTIFGMIPMAFAVTDGAEWRSGMGMIAIGGMTSSTLLTLLVVPVIYTIVDDAQALVARGAARGRSAAARSLRRGKVGAPAATEPAAHETPKPSGTAPA
jgi:HAE1 family hydrophobic/amphiphilic exporter-1